MLPSIIDRYPGSARTLTPLQLTNDALKKRVQALASGLVRTVGLTPEKSTGLILLDDSFGMPLLI